MDISSLKQWKIRYDWIRFQISFFFYVNGKPSKWDNYGEFSVCAIMQSISKHKQLFPHCFGSSGIIAAFNNWIQTYKSLEEGQTKGNLECDYYSTINIKKIDWM